MRRPQRQHAVSVRTGGEPGGAAQRGGRDWRAGRLDPVWEVGRIEDPHTRRVSKPQLPDQLASLSSPTEQRGAPAGRARTFEPLPAGAYCAMLLLLLGTIPGSCRRGVSLR